MWELDHKECLVPKNWCFWTVVLEKTHESLLDSKEIKPVNLTGNQLWIFIGRTNASTEAPILWPPDAKNWLIGKDHDAGKGWRQEEKRMMENEMVGWSCRFDGREFVQVRGLVMDREAWHAAVRGVAKSLTHLSNLTELNSVPAPWSKSRRSLYDRQRPELCRIYIVTWLTPYTPNLHGLSITSKSCVIFCKFLNLSVPESLHL